MAEEKDIKAWKTTENGKHYPILEGETPEQAVNRTFKTGGEKAFRQNTSYYDIIKSDKINAPILSKQEYAVLRKEVMRKNAEQKGSVKPTNYAYTSNYFYVYSTSGDDHFTPLVQFDIEENREIINEILSKFKVK